MDLNLIRPLCTLLEERHVSRAAERCNVTQPAMSRIFCRLREEFQDDLLVRSGRRYERTPRGEQLLAEMRDVLDRVDSAVSGDRFEPERCDAVFRIATTDYVSAVLIPELLADLESRAPLATLELHMSGDLSFEDIIAGRIDIAMISVGDPPLILHREKLFDDDYVCVVAMDHPFACRRSVGLEQYLEQRHIVIDVQHGLQPPIDRPLATYGTRRRIGYRTPFLTSAIYAAAATSMVLTVPRRLAVACTTGVSVRLVPAPRELEQFSYSLIWHNRLEASTAHTWFRDRVRSVTSALAPLAKRETAR